VPIPISYQRHVSSILVPKVFNLDPRQHNHLEEIKTKREGTMVGIVLNKPLSV